MAADPSVSPADTIRRFIDGGKKLLHGNINVPEWQAERALDVLLAVGERDKAEIERLWRGWTTEMSLRNRERERDRRQIAQLTEAIECFLNELDSPNGQYAPTDATEAKLRRAVLADEEDAPPPIDGYELARRISGGAVERIAQFACGEDGCMEIVEVPFDGSPVDSPRCPVHETTMLLGGFLDSAAGEENT